MDTKRIVILDTTLRDGMQGQDISYTLDDKVQIARTMDAFGIDYIEGGFPLSSRKEAEFFQRIAKESLRHARVAAFGSTRKPGGHAAGDPHVTALLAAETPAVVVVGKSWKAHVREVLQTTEDENLRMVSDTVATLKKAGREVIFDLEHFFDGWKDDPAFCRRVLEAATEAGADCLVLCDTNGGTLPSEVARIMAALPAGLAPLGCHFHNDTGSAVANSMAAVEAGAVHVQGTINGWGERCGNANLCVLLPNLCLKMNLAASCAPNLRQLTSLSRYVSEKANIIPDKRQPYVGESAFSHKAGQHADVIAKAPTLMEHVDGALVGNERRILLSELAGKSTIVPRLARYGELRQVLEGGGTAAGGAEAPRAGGVRVRGRGGLVRPRHPQGPRPAPAAARAEQLPPRVLPGGSHPLEDGGADLRPGRRDAADGGGRRGGPRRHAEHGAARRPGADLPVL